MARPPIPSPDTIKPDDPANRDGAGRAAKPGRTTPMMWLVVLAGSAAAVRLALTEAPRPANTVELAAAGWPPRTLRIAGAMVTVTLVGTTLGVLSALVDARSGVLAATAVALWAPVAARPLLRQMVLAGFRTRRDEALLEWLRRIRLYCAAGRPINDAALEAAERVESPAFAPAATSINLALASGQDPLGAAAAHFVGSAAETLVATLAEAERGGAAATDLIDRLIAQAVLALEDQRRIRIEQLSRAVGNTATLAAVVASAVVVLALISSTQIGI